MRHPDFTGHEPCAGVDPDMFYPESFSGFGHEEELRAMRRMCAACPMLGPCGEWAIRHEAHGFWAGMTPADRERARRARGIRFAEPQYSFLPGSRMRDAS